MVEEKEEKRGKQTHGLLIFGGTGESTRRPGPSDEQHTRGVVGLVHPLYSTHNMCTYISCYTHTDTIINMYSMCSNIRQNELHTLGVVHLWYVTYTHITIV